MTEQLFVGVLVYKKLHDDVESYCLQAVICTLGYELAKD
jgi:hypothetical protein